MKTKLSMFSPLRDTSPVLAIMPMRIEFLVPKCQRFIPNKFRDTFDLDIAWRDPIIACTVTRAEHVDIAHRLQIASLLIDANIDHNYIHNFHNAPFNEVTLAKLNAWLLDQDAEHESRGGATFAQLIKHALGLSPFNPS